MRTSQLAAATVAGIAACGVIAAPAHAAIDYDQVNAAVYRGSISGQIAWTNVASGNASITTTNNLSDGRCVTTQYRVARGGAYGDWTTMVILCTKRSYSETVRVSSNGSAVSYWQFRVGSPSDGWAYDTNSPGGA